MRIRLFLVVLFVSIIFTMSCETPAEPPNILIVTGGHGFEKEPFFKMFDELDVTWKHVVQPRGNELIEADSLDAYDALVFYDMYDEITPDQKKAWLAALDNGKGIVFMHHSLANFQNWAEFENIMGGKYVKNTDSVKDLSTYKHDVEVSVHVVDPTHPVTKGMSDFELFDEVYGNFRVNADVTPLLTTNHPESSKTIAWTHKVGNSKIVYLQPGHDHHSYEDTNFRKLVIQAIDYVK